MDFVQVKQREAGSVKKPTIEVYPDFKVTRSKDIVVRGRSFYAIWDEDASLWTTDEYAVQRLVDKEIDNYRVEVTEETANREIHRKYLANFSSNSWMQFRNYIGHISDSHIQLDENITFANTDVKKEDYVTKRVPYALTPGDISAWDELVSKLYDPEERAKIEWAIGAVLTGDAKNIQKFIVFYGSGGTGKSTILEVIQMLTAGYYVTFEAAALTGTSNSFSTEVFADNPLVAIQHDGDLSKIADNSKLNSVVSHEEMTMNIKFKPSYTARINSFLFMGTNKPVKITDSKSGLIRRLIDVHPTGNLFTPKKYQALFSQVGFELGAIAHHCVETYREMGKNYYSGYQPIEMMLQTDVFFNFIEAHYDIFTQQDGVSLKQAYALYKVYCEESDIEFKLPQYKIREELKSYFSGFSERAKVNDTDVYSWYYGFKADKFKSPIGVKEDHMFSLVMDEDEALFDSQFADCPAQYSKEDGSPQKWWDDSPKQRNGKEYIPKASEVVITTLKDLDTTKEHYVKIPENIIVIDFDLKDENGNKSPEANLAAAALWPATYAEFSKSGAGIHLHYDYVGDVTELSRIYDDGIEIKVFSGNSSLRRRVSKANNVPIAQLTGGLPLKEKKVMNSDQVKSEKALRDLVMRNLRKEIHPGTKPSMDFIHKILEDAYKSDLVYDLTDLKPKLLVFANNSSNQSLYCIKLMKTMKFHSENVESITAENKATDDRIVFYDVEVFPNLFLISWKYQGSDTITRMINPKSYEVEELTKMKLVGFNCRRYDNHILYGAIMGYNNDMLYKLSQRIISGDPTAFFGAAYNISYVDIFEFSSKKQSLKKFEIELGIHHMELGLPWDEPVDPSLWELVGIYCDNDVTATEATFDSRKEDFIARQILADLSGLNVNATTQQHAAKIVFGDDKHPQSKFVYTDLSEMFPGYKYNFGKSTYRDEDPSEGGYVYAEPGMHTNVALLDVQSMHPTSIEQLNLFGEYTQNFSDIKQARIAIKLLDYDNARTMLDGKLAKYLKDESESEALSNALKIVINIVYGLTSAKFDNAFRDPRNIDNIVAKRGALFMIELKHYVQSLGYQVAHIKTDSIKIPNADEKIIELVMAFGTEYGYTFEHEATYDRMCLVNDAVYIAHVGWAAKAKKIGTWEAVGAQFQHPYVFKYLFSHEPITFNDMCESKSVNSSMYLDFTNMDTTSLEDDIPMAFADLSSEENDEHSKMLFIGKTGMFCPIEPGMGGGTLLRVANGNFYAVTGTKGWTWLEAEQVKTLHKEDRIDGAYFEKLVNAALDQIQKYGDTEYFLAA